MCSFFCLFFLLLLFFFLLLFFVQYTVLNERHHADAQADLHLCCSHMA